jgi:hypothetical protein
MSDLATFSKVRVTPVGHLGLKISLGTESLFALSPEGEKAIETPSWANLCPKSITFHEGTPLKLHVGDTTCLGLLCEEATLKTSNRVNAIDPQTANLLRSSYPTYMVMHVKGKIWDHSHPDYIIARSILTMSVNLRVFAEDSLAS